MEISLKFYKSYLLALIFVLLNITGCQQQNTIQIEALKEAYLAELHLTNSNLLITEVANNLEVPWEITWGPDNWIWFTEQKGTISKVNPETQEVKQLLSIPQVHYQKSRGLLGMAVHPDFTKQPYVYLHYTFLVKGEKLFNHETRSRLVSYKYDAQRDTLINSTILLDNIPGKTFHNGSRVIISSDHKIFLSTGDAGNTQGCQDINVLSGKLLRLNTDGSIPEDNPIKGSYVYSWGHRNAQGLTFGRDNVLYSSEHGPNNDDEVNLIRPSANYGWPNVEGFCDKNNEQDFCKEFSIVEPIYAWTPTIAPSGISYYDNNQIPEWKNSLIMGSLKGRSLRILKLNENGDKVIDHEIYFQKVFGRIRDVCVSPKGDVYLATSNLDWHPKFQPQMYDQLPKDRDDKIIKLSKVAPSLIAELQIDKPQVLEKEVTEIESVAEVSMMSLANKDYEAGEALYLQHCSSCHQPNGEGLPDLIPPLAKTDWVTGNTSKLIAVVLAGTSEPMEVNGKIYEQEMPGFSASLQDEEIALILTYIRSHFGNEANAVHKAFVTEERRGLKL
ncbi:MAG: PQQ-dependent sugar dehydrogenase [Bacteroidota bacterium]